MRRLAFAALLALAACGSEYLIYVRGVAPLNVNDRGESVPVNILILHLKDDQKFRQAPWDRLFKSDLAAQTLGEDKIGEKTYTVYPGKADDAPVVVQLGELPTDCRFVGIVAQYDNMQGDAEGPRHVVVPKDEADDHVIEFTNYKIVLKQ